MREKLFEKSLSRALFKKLSILIIICVLMFRLPYLLPAGDCDKQKRPQRIAILIIIYFESFWGESSREGLFAKSSSLVIAVYYFFPSGSILLTCLCAITRR
jgi:hypothetical protein